MAGMYSQYERTFTSFGGPDIVPIFNNKIIGECQALTYSIRREKAELLYSNLGGAPLFINIVRGIGAL